jgi:hypothetical protein
MVIELFKHLKITKESNKFKQLNQPQPKSVAKVQLVSSTEPELFALSTQQNPSNLIDFFLVLEIASAPVSQHLISSIITATSSCQRFPFLLRRSGISLVNEKKTDVEKNRCCMSAVSVHLEQSLQLTKDASTQKKHQQR